MPDLLLEHGRIVCEHKVVEGFCFVQDGKITAIGSGDAGGEVPAGVKRVDLKGNYLVPGFIDMHTHGGGGCDFMDGTAEAVVTAARCHLSHGTTSICPTTMASDDEALFGFLDAYEQARRITKQMPHMLGVHLEGPYFSPEQAGAQPPEYMQCPFPSHFNRVLEYAGGNIIRWSSAPEVAGVVEIGDELKRRGILPAIAHTDADLSVVEQAMAHGYRLLTHFYSGMSSLHRVDGHRILGVVEAGYLYDELWIEMIGDGIHLPPKLLQLILKCKPHNKICLVTDSMRAAGMPEGPSVLGSLQNGQAVIVEDGVAKMPDRKSFAGSTATADRMIRVMVKQAGLSLPEAVGLMTLNPARLLGIDGFTGSLAPKKVADMVELDEELQVRRVFVTGEPVFGTFG